MNTLVLILFDLFVVWFFFGQTLKQWFSPAWLKAIFGLRDIERHYRHLLRRDRDVLSPELNEEIASTAAALRIARQQRSASGGMSEEASSVLAAQPGFAGFAQGVERDGFTAAATGLVAELQAGKAGPSIPARKRAWLREHLEIAVVALGLAFGVRALFLQPFKIPTGSMQPTLYGIHFIHSESGPPKFGPVGRFFGYLHYSRRYVDLTVLGAGDLDLDGISKVEQPIPLQNWLLPKSRVNIGAVGYVLPGTPEVVRKYLLPVVYARGRKLGHDRPFSFEAGELLLRGHLELGDHLFVDRTYLPFHEPHRGDVTVFRTDGIRQPPDTKEIRARGGRLNGPYYIKRLVGMPGDELRVREDHVQVRRPGETEFRELDATDHSGFGRIYSGRGGYRGHSDLGGFCLSNPDDIFYIPRQGDLLKIDVLTLQSSIKKVDADEFVPYRDQGVALPIMTYGVSATLAWLDQCGWFEPVEDGIYRFRYDHFLMMGDNTANSSDGRAWGTIPRANLVGRASLIWWPFTRRWGRTDRLAPLDFPSPPTRYDLVPLGADVNE
ncbi:MAG: hypothetical protein HN849_34700 [Victivallales bacterium]|nr:hypothetical protein [Victivallales bacterium]